MFSSTATSSASEVSRSQLFDEGGHVAGRSAQRGFAHHLLYLSTRLVQDALASDADSDQRVYGSFIRLGRETDSARSRKHFPRVRVSLYQARNHARLTYGEAGRLPFGDADITPARATHSQPPRARATEHKLRHTRYTVR